MSRISFHALFAGMLLIVAIPVFGQRATRIHQPKTGLVLSGGGAKGFAHIGAIRVFEEAGLQFDYIGGTSMGSIFGSLYALGYHPDTMQKIVRQQNWDFLMSDKVERRYIPIEEKQNADRFIMTFPVEEKKVKLKTGLYTGQMVDLLLSKYLSPAYRINDFNKLPVPFLCIATDLSDGSNVVLDKGVLHKAIRASMSIPGYFTPVTRDGRLLVDGGVINNFPVEEIKKRGADIIIGVDVQTGLLGIEKLNSAIRVLDQVTAFYRNKANEKAVLLTDYYIKPELSAYDMMSFNDYEAIIKKGEEAARAQLPALKHLADSLNRIRPKKMRKLNASPLDSIFISQLRYEGLRKVSNEFLNGVLEIQPGSWIRLDEVLESVKRAYGSGFFDQLNFYFEPDGDGACLVFEVNEASSGMFGMGLHYDSDYKVGLLLNATLKNVWIKGSKLFTDLNLGENPRLKTLFIVDRGHKPGFGFHASGLNLKMNVYNKDLIEDVYSFNQYNLGAFGQWTFRNTMRFRIGARLESTSLKSGFGNPVYDDSFSQTFVAESGWAIDSYDKNYFSSTGQRINLLIKYVAPIAPDSAEYYNGKGLVVMLDSHKNFPINKKNTLKFGLTAGASFRDNPLPITHWFMLGGQSNFSYFDGFIPFAGHRFVEKAGMNQATIHFAWQYKFADKFYISPIMDMGVISDDFADMFVSSGLMAGYGGTFSYDSFVGPVELSLMGGNHTKGLQLFINIGYWF